MSALDQLLLNRYRDQTPDVPTPLPTAEQEQAVVAITAPQPQADTDDAEPATASSTESVVGGYEGESLVESANASSAAADVSTAVVEPVEDADLTPVNLDAGTRPVVNEVTPVAAESATLEDVVEDAIVSDPATPNSGPDAVESLLEEVLLGQPSVRSHRIIPAVDTQPSTPEPYTAITVLAEQPMTVAAASAPVVDEAQAVVDESECVPSDFDVPEAELEATEDLEATEVFAATEEVEASVVEESNEMSSEFKAQWEVDRFFWPEICGAVETRLEAEVATTVSSLRRDCRDRDCNVVAVTSGKLGAGRTTMSLVLVRELARQGVSTVVVDFDCQRPSLSERLGVNVDEGIESLQHEDVTPSSICVHAVEENIGIMPLVVPIDASHCVSQVVQEAIVTLGQHYDMVIIDASQDAAELMAQEVAYPRFLTIVVSDNGSETQVQQLAVRVSQQNGWPAGVIQNFAA